jgi:hypothetical protein
MGKAMMSLRVTASAVVAGVLLGGCVQQPQTLYQWESYQPEVYQYFEGESKDQQIEALERDLQKIRSTNRLAPPGYHAQLGLLYLDVGKDDQMVQEFKTEKVLFPESAQYMDFLLKNAKKGS